MRNYIPLITAAFATWTWAGGAEMKISVWNNHDEPIITSARGPGNPELLEDEHATIYPGEVTNYHSFGSGTIAVNELKNGNTNDDSLIEVNVDGASGRQVFDVSLVDGFSLPIVCGCLVDGETMNWVNGCNLDLVEINGGCPDEMDTGKACRNPLRSNQQSSSAASFFKPCEHAAWTYVSDGAAGNNGECVDVGEPVRCCVGSRCAPSNRQREHQGIGGDDDEDEDGEFSRAAWGASTDTEAYL